MNKNKNIILNSVVIATILLLFWGYKIPRIIDFYNTLHNPISGIITSYEYNNNQSAYIYHTNRGNSLDSRYFFKNCDEINANKGDLIMKFPHSLDLYLCKLDTNGLVKLDHKTIGFY